MVKYNCPIAIFLENHYDPQPTTTLTKILPALKKYGYEVFASEDSEPITLNGVIRAQSQGIETLRYRVEEEAVAMRHMLENSVALLSKVKSLGFKFVAMDMHEDEKTKMIAKYGLENFQESWMRGENSVLRDDIMADNIHKSCQKYHSGIIVLVGSGHHAIQKHLKNKFGYDNIKSFYITTLDSVVDIYDIEPYLDILMRNKGVEGIEFKEKHSLSSLEVIDLYQDPTLDPRKIVMDIIGMEAPNNVEN